MLYFLKKVWYNENHYKKTDEPAKNIKIGLG